MPRLPFSKKKVLISSLLVIGLIVTGIPFAYCDSPPVASFSHSLSSNEGYVVLNIVDNSYEPDSDDFIARWEWWIEMPNGGVDHFFNELHPLPGGGEGWSWTDIPEGDYTITLRVTDQKNLNSTDYSSTFYVPSTVSSFQILNIYYPSTVEPGETFDIQVEYSYSFTETTHISVDIYEPSSDSTLASEEDDVSGDYSESKTFSITAFDSPGKIELQAQIWFIQDGNWVHYEDGWVQQINVDVATITDPGIPGFPSLSVFLGLMLIMVVTRLLNNSAITL